MRKIRDEVSLNNKLETITVMDFRNSPGEVFSSVQLGKRFIITKCGKAIAIICQAPCDLSNDWLPKKRR